MKVAGGHIHGSRGKPLPAPHDSPGLSLGIPLKIEWQKNSKQTVDGGRREMAFLFPLFPARFLFSLSSQPPYYRKRSTPQRRDHPLEPPLTLHSGVYDGIFSSAIQFQSTQLWKSLQKSWIFKYPFNSVFKLSIQRTCGHASLFSILSVPNVGFIPWIRHAKIFHDHTAL